VLDPPIQAHSPVCAFAEEHAVPAAKARRSITATQDAMCDLRTGFAVAPKLIEAEEEEAEERCIGLSWEPG
jgi:hypothetical protein